VHSTANATAAANARTLKLKRTAEELDKLTRTAGTRYYPDADAVTRKITQITSKRKVTAYLRTEVTLDPDTQKPTLAWHFDQQAIDAEAATDGWYALLSNLDLEEADAAEVLIRYKGQLTVERRYGEFKGPLAVTPMFLHHNRRIAALITVICLALLIFCLIEREVRRALHPATGLVGFYTLDNRTVKPTGRLILFALSRIRYLPAHDGTPPQILIPEQIQVHLLELLKIDPTQPRWTTERFPTCEIQG
jgi:transposase